jgi:hypothetical protein
MTCTHVLQHLDFPTHNPNLLIILTLQLIQHRIGVLAFLVRRSRPEPSVPATSPTIAVCARIRAETRVGAQM